ncbi:MAG: 23S rRNA (adenine(2503)-C(2))-methyltransferase RlmN [Desulfobacterales bacterium]|nr:23S rRNA (adenine(2503)-C(2))-methyltransferase RlmN [Desulfobacterales bacterium]
MNELVTKTDIKELSKIQLIDWLKRYDIPSYRAGQILMWIYARQINSFEEMTDLAKPFRSTLADHFCNNRLQKITVETSKDGSKKYLFQLSDGNLIECVLIPEKDYQTLCISTQVGCAQGCKFCLTAKNGLTRNLTRGEIVSQVRDVANDIDDAKPLRNIVVMGMGEPLANYDNLVSALKSLTSVKAGMNFSSRRITVSTAGMVPKIPDFGRDTSISLAISLNATDNKTRSSLMPINRKYPIETLIEACKNYPLKSRQRITFEYILIKDINDSAENAEALAGLLRPVKAKINLIPFNEHDGTSYKRPSESAIQGFRNILVDNNYTVITRYSKGQDISAACGQLRAKAR